MTNYDSDNAMTMLGVPGRLIDRTTKPGQAPGLWCRQRWISEQRPITGYGCKANIRAEVRFDDDCGNGHNSFAITGDVYATDKRSRAPIAAGCLHEDIAKAFPELAPLIMWHLTSSDGPMHYLANTLYFCDIARTAVGELRRSALKNARSCAVWPTATNEELSLPRDKLEILLEARLPFVLSGFRRAVESTGFKWSPEDFITIADRT